MSYLADELDRIARCADLDELKREALIGLCAIFGPSSSPCLRDSVEARELVAAYDARSEELRTATPVRPSEASV